MNPVRMKTTENFVIHPAYVSTHSKQSEMMNFFKSSLQFKGESTNELN